MYHKLRRKDAIFPKMYQSAVGDTEQLVAKEVQRKHRQNERHAYQNPTCIIIQQRIVHSVIKCMHNDHHHPFCTMLQRQMAEIS